jgi:hypothetical protein
MQKQYGIVITVSVVIYSKEFTVPPDPGWQEKWATHVAYTEFVLFDEARSEHLGRILPQFIVRMQKTKDAGSGIGVRGRVGSEMALCLPRGWHLHSARLVGDLR